MAHALTALSHYGIWLSPEIVVTGELIAQWLTPTCASLCGVSAIITLTFLTGSWVIFHLFILCNLLSKVELGKSCFYSTRKCVCVGGGTRKVPRKTGQKQQRVRFCVEGGGSWRWIKKNVMREIRKNRSDSLRLECFADEEHYSMRDGLKKKSAIERS